MAEVEFTAAKGEQMRALRLAVRQRDLTPAEAEARAVAADLPSFIAGFEERHDITSNSTWWLPVAVLFYAWRDLAKTRREYERFDVWGRHLWRNPQPAGAVLSLEEAENLLKADLEAGIVRAFGRNSDQVLTPIQPAEWRDMQLDGHQPFSVCRNEGSVFYSGVFVLRHEVVPLWLQETPGLPAAVPSTPEPMLRERSEDPKPQKRAGGRPTVYDWAGAAGYVAGFIAENDYPSDEEQLVKQVENWFEQDRGRAPGHREIQSFVSEVYKHRRVIGKP